MHPTYLDYIVTGQDSIIKRWIRRGIKGWRLDVADELPDEFIQHINKESKTIDKDSVILGEVWEDASNKVSYGKLRKYFLGNELDSVMNYPFKETFIKFVLGDMDGADALKNMMSLYENYPREYFYSCMNLIGSHDTVRALTILGEAPAEYKIEDIDAFEYELTTEQYQLGIRRMKILSFLQATFPGIPCIYYGDEVGVQGFRDPYCRKTYPWGKENLELLDWYRKIFNLRDNLEALKKGVWEPYICKDGVFSFVRVYGNDKLLCVINASQGTKEIQISSKNAYDIINDCPIEKLLIAEGISCHLIKMTDSR
jgi:4-alpha-glucanotransferase